MTGEIEQTGQPKTLGSSLRGTMANWGPGSALGTSPKPWPVGHF